MSKRTAKFVSAIFASLLLGAPLVTASHGAPAEADKCLSGPKGAPPAGGHWYYRVDRATKRACWYIGDAKEKLARAAPETSPPAANSASPPDSASTQSSIANARAELPLPQSRVEPDTSVFTGQRAAAAVTGAINPENAQRANAGDAGAQRSVVASRWPELAGINTPASPGPSTDNSAASAPENSGAAPTPSRALSRTSAFRGRATGRRGRAPACRSGRIVNRKADRLGPDAADRHPRRTGACGPAGERDFQVQRPATERPSRQSRRAARELGFGPERSSVAIG